LSLVYALGLSLVYASLDFLPGMSGTIFGTISSNPGSTSAMANVLMIAGLGDARRDSGADAGSGS